MTRFEHLSRGAASACLVLVAALMALGLWISFTPAPPDNLPPPPPEQGGGDLGLYRGIVAKMRHGGAYEPTAIAEHRAKLYPLRPFLVVRPPLLANFLARLPSDAVGDMILAALGLAGIAAWAVRLLELKLRPVGLAFMIVAVVSGAIPAMVGNDEALFHETWAGLLIFLSLAVRTEKHFVISVLLGLLAAVVRELAMPYLLVMSVVALWERRWTEGGAFAVALLASLGALAVHAHAVQQLTTAADMASPGWVKLGGWRFVLSTGQWNMFVVALGLWLASLFIPLSLVGAAAMKGPTGLRLALLLAGYTLGFIVIGRPSNLYWGLIPAPLAGVALAFAPMGLWQLGQRAGLVRTAQAT